MFSDLRKIYYVSCYNSASTVSASLYTWLGGMQERAQSLSQHSKDLAAAEAAHSEAVALCDAQRTDLCQERDTHSAQVLASEALVLQLRADFVSLRVREQLKYGVHCSICDLCSVPDPVHVRAWCLPASLKLHAVHQVMSSKFAAYILLCVYRLSLKTLLLGFKKNS